ncbi:UNVERIFIED_CONTAM: hypothetical protein Scaly_2376900 [Sesamum calycinum]|uniref:Uncharacterized protein n=1 Tax=Sesamum calycinum TaxID=2727403 RepID=A0AAW2M0G7_9LAMI
MIVIRIKEEHRNQTYKMPVEHQPRANLIVEKQEVNKINTKLKANKPCWNCGQVGHWVKFILIKRPRLDRQISIWLWEVLAVLAQEQLKTTSGRTVSMENSSITVVLGIGSVDLKFPSGRILSLKRVHHVPTVRRNIISGSKLLGFPSQY